MRKYIITLLALSLMLSCKKEDEPESTDLTSESGEELSGGRTTVFDDTPNAFSRVAPNLDNTNGLNFFVGNSFFDKNWVTAPATTTARDGLGPFYNAISCAACHTNDGRGRAPMFDGELSHGLLLRLSIPGADANGGPVGEPTYGGQLQDQSIMNVISEGGFSITYVEETGEYTDGQSYTLRKPTYSFNNLSYGAMDPSVLISPRVAQQMIGLGLLEAIHESTILSFSDESDADNDGISGKPNYVWDAVNQTTSIGRFGWKASQPSLLQQAAGAFLGDIGITSPIFNSENCPDGFDCSAITHGGTPEIDQDDLEMVTLYSQTLAVPARRDWSSQDVLRGKELFMAANCSGCHIPKITTGSHDVPALANQTIRPFTDLLLHDMGDGLADNRPDFEATGNEWRTPPLWGIGLFQTVNSHTNYLHDGRARNLEEAILWHGGEAENSVTKFKSYSEGDRNKVITFLNTL